MSKKVVRPESLPLQTDSSTDAFGYNDDVTPETVDEIRRQRGVEVSQPRWKIIDAMGQIVTR